MNRLALCFACFALAACAPTDVPTDAPTAPSGAAPASAAVARDPARNGARAGAWRRAESDRQGVPIAWEFRVDVDAARRATLPQLVVVSVMNPAAVAANGRLNAATLDTYDRIERDLVGLLAGKGDLVAVLDYYQQYDWYFYAANIGDVDAIRALFAKSGLQDVTINVEDDAKGEFYSTLRSRVDAR